MDVPRIVRPPTVGGRPSAVLILFGEGAEGPDLLYIQRSASLRSHPGQPAFPGGAIEDGDDGPVAAALREAAEETGLDPSGVDVLAVLPELYISRSGFRVAPVIGWWREPSQVRPASTGEVAAVERIPVAALADPRHRFMLRGPSGNLGPAFDIGPFDTGASGSGSSDAGSSGSGSSGAGESSPEPMLIWGFTAVLTDRLLALGGWERPWDATVTRDLPGA
ncbi:MAG: CoA pyrophosphatase [Nocardiopsaceae bacterium]|nr:CoA pyrophosphatase [Nocardiopsaceae bacterium]